MKLWGKLYSGNETGWGLGLTWMSDRTHLPGTQFIYWECAFSKSKKFTFIYCGHTHVWMNACVVLWLYVRSSVNSVYGSVLSFHHVGGSQGPKSIVRLGGKCLYLLSHLPVTPHPDPDPLFYFKRQSLTMPILESLGFVWGLMLLSRYLILKTPSWCLLSSAWCGEKVHTSGI